MLFLLNIHGVGLVAHLQVRQRCAHSLGLLVLTFLVNGDKAGELHGLVRAAEHMTGALGINGNGIVNGVCHLGCQETAPDQLVQPVLILVQAALNPLGIQFHMGGTDGFVGILGTGLGLEYMELTIIIVFTVAVTDEVGSCCHSLIGKTQRVGTHIGDQTQSALACHIHAFIKLLGNGHGTLGGEAQLPGCLLLEGGSGERRRGRTLLLCLLHIGDGKFLTGNVIHDRLGFCFVIQFPLLILAPVTGQEGTGLTDAVQLYIQRPVFLRLEGADLVFTIHDQTGGHGLDAAGRKASSDLLPQQRRQLVTDDAVQNTSCLLGIYQIVVNISGVCNGFPNHLLGNLVEGDTVCFGVREIQEFLQMPGNSFSLPVRVSCQVDRVYLFGGGLQFFDQIFLALDRDILGGEITLQVHAHGGFGKIPQMAHTCLDGIVRAQIFTNGFRLGGRLHND